MLHLVFQAQADRAILDRISAGDVAVFLDSGVLGILQNGLIADALAEKLADSRFYALSEDMTIRGIATDELVVGIEAINYAELVRLTVENSLIQSWC
jgi:tRNA 2-thiouridine synthesizing protein B